MEAFIICPNLRAWIVRLVSANDGLGYFTIRVDADPGFIGYTAWTLPYLTTARKVNDDQQWWMMMNYSDLSILVNNCGWWEWRFTTLKQGS